VRLNWLGRAAMNSPARALAQSYVASRFERLGGRVEAGRVLEIGCGGGAGVRLIIERFGAAEVQAIDMDSSMIDRARFRLSSYPHSRVHLSVGDARSLEAGDQTFDAVFDFGAIHLEPQWAQAVAEIARVLKPGGRYYFELVTSRALRLSYPLFTEAFASMPPPRSQLFVTELERNGIVVVRYVRPRLAALTGWVGDLIGVGRRV